MFLALAVCKLAQQWLRGSWSQSTKQRISNNYTTLGCVQGMKKGYLFLPRAPEGIFINFPLKWEMTAWHCSVVSILLEKTHLNDSSLGLQDYCTLNSFPIVCYYKALLSEMQKMSINLPMFNVTLSYCNRYVQTWLNYPLRNLTMARVSQPTWRSPRPDCCRCSLWGSAWRPPGRRAAAWCAAPSRPQTEASWRCTGLWGPAPAAAHMTGEQEEELCFRTCSDF